VKKHQLNLRLNDEELKRLKRLCAHYGLEPSSLVRMLLKEKAREIQVP
jgi:antitoxin component of RelBE/YafQ-DinJ toxin-antitoxin module